MKRNPPPNRLIPTLQVMPSKRQESAIRDPRTHSCSPVHSDSTACQVCDAASTRWLVFPPPRHAYLGDVVSAVFATDGFDGAHVQPSKDLGAGVNPLLVPVGKGGLN